MVRFETLHQGSVCVSEFVGSSRRGLCASQQLHGEHDECSRPSSSLLVETTGVRLRIGAGVDECVDERTGVMSRLQRSRSRSFPVAPQPSRRHAGEGAESSILHSLFRRDAALLSPTLRDHRRRLATD